MKLHSQADLALASFSQLKASHSYQCVQMASEYQTHTTKRCQHFKQDFALNPKQQEEEKKDETPFHSVPLPVYVMGYIEERKADKDRKNKENSLGVYRCSMLT